MLSQDGALDGPRTLAAADIDGDGRLDIITAGSFSDDVMWFPQAAGGAFSPARMIDTGGVLEDPLQLIAEDVNGDGMVDLLAVGNESDNVVAFIQDSATRGAFFLYNMPLGDGIAPVAIVCANLLGDGLPDIAVASLGGVDIFEHVAAMPAFPAALEAGCLSAWLMPRGFPAARFFGVRIRSRAHSMSP